MAPPTTDRAPATATRGSGLRAAVVVLALLTVLTEAWQFVTAGQLFSGDALAAHQAGAIVLHVVSGLTAVVAFLAHRRAVAPGWLWVLAAVVFALTFVQAWTGGGDTLWVHVPGAMVVTVGSVWVLAAASLLRARRAPSATSSRA